MTLEEVFAAQRSEIAADAVNGSSGVIGEAEFSESVLRKSLKVQSVGLFASNGGSKSACSARLA